MKAIRYILFATIACSAVACTDWDDHYDNTAVGEGNLTLWQQMKQNSELSDFCEVLEHTNLFRMHKKTKASYAEILNSGQSFTVMAPVNGTFNKDSLLALTETAKGDSVVEKFFVKNHIARSANSATAAQKTIHMMNDKRVSLVTGSVNGVAVKQGNIHAKNGILNVMERQLPYYYNLYEQMTDRPEYKSVGDFIRSYDREEFDQANSVQNGTVDGVPVYIDSVMISRNDFLTRYLGAKLASEDSTYWMVVPKGAGWQQAFEEAKSCFKYPTSEDKADSLQLLNAYRAMFKDAIFTMTTQQNPTDSLRSLDYNANYPEYSVFRKPFAPGGLLAGAVRTPSSNGVLYETDGYPFDPTQTYNRKVEQEAENTGYIINNEKCTYASRSLSADSISREGYLDIQPSSNTANWSVKFRLSDVKSTAYDVCVVVLPQNITDPEAAAKPYQFKADIGYIDANGAKKSYTCSWVDQKNKKQTKFNTNDPLRVDTIVLAKDFVFPTCNWYEQTNEHFYLTLTCSMSAAENKKYSRPIYIDCILLKPKARVEADEARNDGE